MLAFVIIFVAAGYTLGSGRTIPTIAAVVGLVSVVVGGLALFRPSIQRIGASISLVLGLIGAAVGGTHAAYAAGSFGTGNGLAGAVVALALGLIGMIIGGLGVARKSVPPT